MLTAEAPLMFPAAMPAHILILDAERRHRAGGVLPVFPERGDDDMTAILRAHARREPRPQIIYFGPDPEWTREALDAAPPPAPAVAPRREEAVREGVVLPPGLVRFTLTIHGEARLPLRRTCAPVNRKSAPMTCSGPVNDTRLVWDAEVEVSALDERGYVVRAEDVGPAAFGKTDRRVFDSCEQIAAHAVAALVSLAGGRATRALVIVKPNGGTAGRQAAAEWKSQ